MYIEEENINNIITNLKSEIDEVDIVNECLFYDGELVGSDFKMNLTSGKSTIFIDIFEINTFDSQIQHGEDCQLVINLYVVAGTDARAYDKSIKNASIVCINTIEKIKRKLRNNFLGVDLNVEPKISGARKIFNSSVESKGSVSTYLMTCIYEFTYIKDLQ
jgi:hypothetical protein